MGRYFVKLVGLVICIHQSIAAYANNESDMLENWVIERTEYSALLDNNSAVAITNHHGDIRVRTSSDDMISIFAITQHHTDDDVKPDIQIQAVDNTLMIAVRYPEKNRQDSDNPIDPVIMNRRVDISLLIPKYVNLSMETLDGRAESKGHQGRVQVKTNSGQVILVTSGAVNISSAEGPVTVTFKNDTWGAPSSIETSTGKIQVLFIENPDINVEIETGGTITTDYSVEIRHRIPASAQKQATARIGKATQPLNIKSVLGPVTLSRIFNMMKSS